MVIGIANVFKLTNPVLEHLSSSILPVLQNSINHVNNCIGLSDRACAIALA